MNNNHIIELNHYRSAVHANHPKAVRKSCPSAALCFIENAVTATIGLCVLFSMILVVTML